MSRPAPRLAVLLACTAWLAGAAPALAQCAMCRTAVEQSAEGQAMAESLNLAILLLLAAPYAVFGTCLAVLFRRRIAARLAGWRRQARLLLARTSP